MNARTFAAALALAAGVAALGAVNAPAQALPGQVTGLTVVQQEGFATLSWTPIPGVTEYQIVRTPVNDLGAPTGPAAVAGVWQPQRTVTPDNPRFADAGFALGGRYQWNVGAAAPSPGPLSEPVIGTTRPQWGTGPGASLRTGWETSGNATYTTDAQEYAYTAALDAASDRVRVVEIGRTNPVSSAPSGRPINMLVIGYPSPPATAQEISASPAIIYNCNVHGDEPQGRESCLILARMLVFTEDPHLLEVLSKITVLIVPTINGNGRAANTRGNETGQDLNRDHAGITQPETKAFAAALRDYTPEVGIDLHEGDNEDLPILSARHRNVHEPMFLEGKNGLIEWMYQHAAVDGWWTGPYNNGGDSHEGILRNTFGLKNMIGMLAESRPDGGATRPAETGSQLANRNRKSYASLWQEFQALEYYSTRLDLIHERVEQSIAFNKANVGPVITRGAYPWPYDPRHGANTAVPSVDAPTAARTINPPPCAYFLTETQYSGARTAGTVALRFGVHGIAVDHRPSGHIVRLAQPLRGLIPTLLDAAAVSPEPIVATTRLFDCPHVTASPRSFAAVADEGDDTAETLTVGNAAVEVEEDLNWTVTEAATSCSTPGDLDWVDADPTAGTTAAGSETEVSLTFSAAGITGPATRSGLLCLSSNDAGEALIALPLTFKIRDATAPITSAVVSPAAPITGWYRAAPTVTLSASDGAGSGVELTEYRLDDGAFVRYEGPFEVGGDGVHTLEYRSTDRAGNVEPASSLTISVDGTAPAIAIATPLDGSSFVLGSAATADYSCSDAASGVGSCAGTVADGAALDTSSVGPRQFTVDAADVAGNTASRTVSYAVVYAWSGFFAPVSNDRLNVVENGSTVPLKFSLGGDFGLGILAAGSPRSEPVVCATGETTGSGSPTASSTGLTFSDGRYHYNWRTEASWTGTCRALVLALNDGTVHRATFQFK